MTPEQKRDIRDLVEFYDERNWDWSNIVEFLIRKYHKSLPWDEWSLRQSSRPKPGRPRKVQSE